jgi:hypothetical protein
LFNSLNGSSFLLTLVLPRRESNSIFTLFGRNSGTGKLDPTGNQMRKFAVKVRAPFCVDRGNVAMMFALAWCR